MDIGTGLAGLNAAIETLKSLRGLEKAYDQAVLRSQIVDLMGHVSDAKLTLLEAREEIASRDAEIEALKAKLKQQAETVEFRGYTYALSEDGKPTGVPFCGGCLASDGTQVRLNNLMDRHYQCPRCKALASNVTRLP